MAQRREDVEKAKIAEQAERYDDMVQAMKSVVVNAETDLSDEERNLLSVAYKNVVGARRSAWRIISSLIAKAEDDAKVAWSKKYRERVETELRAQCSEVLGLIDEHLLKNMSKDDSNSNFEAKVFYLKMKGDYYRYLVEIEPMDSSARNDTLNKSRKAYEEATTEAGNLLTTHPIRLGLALNFSVFYYEIEGSPDKACEVAKTAFDDAMSHLTALKEESAYKDSAMIMQLLRDNLTLWQAENEEDKED